MLENLLMKKKLKLENYFKFYLLRIGKYAFLKSKCKK